MSKARSLILAKLYQHNNGAELPSPPSFRPEHGWSLEEKIERFTKMLKSVHGEVHLIQRSEVQAYVEQILEKNDVKKLLCSQKVVENFPNKFDGIERYHYDQPIEEWKPALFKSIDASITTSRGGIAETGSLILWPDHYEPRLMSLVPPIHIALLEADSIYETFSQAMEEQNWAEQMPTNALLISGPSKTADIEQILAYGIHGPKQLIVLIIE